MATGFDAGRVKEQAGQAFGAFFGNRGGGAAPAADAPPVDTPVAPDAPSPAPDAPSPVLGGNAPTEMGPVADEAAAPSWRERITPEGTRSTVDQMRDRLQGMLRQAAGPVEGAAPIEGAAVEAAAAEPRATIGEDLRGLATSLRGRAQQRVAESPTVGRVRAGIEEGLERQLGSVLGGTAETAETAAQADDTLKRGASKATELVVGMFSKVRK